MTKDNSGKRIKSIEYIMESTKSSPGKTGLFVEAKGYWEIVYKENPPATFVIIDEAANISSDVYDRIIEGIKK